MFKINYFLFFLKKKHVEMDAVTQYCCQYFLAVIQFVTDKIWWDNMIGQSVKV